LLWPERVGARELTEAERLIVDLLLTCWLVALAFHVAAHSKTVVHLAGKNIARHTRMRTTSARCRLLTLISSLLLGGAIALALAHRAETYLHLYSHK
jgi:hypothetical protein